MQKLTCTKDFTMECGTVAFYANRQYDFRYATLKEEDDHGCQYAFSSEIGDGHLLSYEDVKQHFE